MNCQDVVDSYIKYLGDSFTCEEKEDGFIVYTPFIGLDGDPVSFYIREIAPGKLLLTDMGETLFYLEMFGIDVSRGRNKEHFLRILSAYGISEVGGELLLKTNPEKLAQDMNTFILALQAAMHLEFRKTPAKPMDFHKKAHLYCEANQIPHRYQWEIKAKGRHIIDLVSIDEKVLVQALGTTLETPNQIKRYTEVKLFPFLELKLLDREEYKVALYDESVPWDEDSLTLIESYPDEIIKWSERKKLAEVLSP